MRNTYTKDVLPLRQVEYNNILILFLEHTTLFVLSILCPHFFVLQYFAVSFDSYCFSFMSSRDRGYINTRHEVVCKIKLDAEEEISTKNKWENVQAA
jgi:hypothetical protein